MAKKPASVITSTSRFCTCVSSCAITPSSSAGESSSMIPVVAQTVADFGERPSANAFGIAVCATATFGFGRSACTHRRSIIACSCGACSGVTTRAPIAASASLSEANRFSAARPPAMIATVTPLTPEPSSATTSAT